MQLVKIYDTTCDICSMLAGLDEQVAEDNSFSFRKMTIEECASTPGDLRDYVVNVYVNPNEGEIEIPIYLLLTPQGAIQASGVIKTIEELNNLIYSHQLWASSKSV